MMNPETPASPQQPTPPKRGGGGPATAQPAPAAGSKAAAQPKTPPLYRQIDWFTFGITTVLIFIGYMLTLSPDLTLEDCGELAVGSKYAVARVRFARVTDFAREQHDS